MQTTTHSRLNSAIWLIMQVMTRKYKYSTGLEVEVESTYNLSGTPIPFPNESFKT
jgi:hypothetical protein